MQKLGRSKKKERNERRRKERRKKSRLWDVTQLHSQHILKSHSLQFMWALYSGACDYDTEITKFQPRWTQPKELCMSWKNFMVVPRGWFSSKHAHVTVNIQ